jgi:hypothetical protein
MIQQAEGADLNPSPQSKLLAVVRSNSNVQKALYLLITHGMLSKCGLQIAKTRPISIMCMVGQYSAMLAANGRRKHRIKSLGETREEGRGSSCNMMMLMLGPKPDNSEC